MDVKTMSELKNVKREVAFLKLSLRELEKRVMELEELISSVIHDIERLYERMEFLEREVSYE